MAHQPTFDEMFGGATTNVDYTAPETTGHRLLPVPEENDSLSEIARKMRAIANIVETGRSAAVYTGFKGAASQERDAEKIALQAMTATERGQYDAWKARVKLPDFLWAAYKDKLPEGKSAQKRFEMHAAAMGRIWAFDKAEAAHAAWLFRNWSYAIPLVTAVEKVIGAERGLHGGLKKLNEYELAEIQTIHRFNSIAMDRVNKVYEELNRVARDINHSKSILQAREHALKRNIDGYKHKKDPINDQRAFVGLPEIGNEFDYRMGTQGGRSARTDLLGGTPLTEQTARGSKRARVSEPSRDLGGLGGGGDDVDEPMGVPGPSNA
ncbi:hypothetical protein [Beauveria bassiana bipartite mycovirus 1]|nr:hypothetical protein [Beauveria bassiana bipartite mycovirus 1]